MRCAISRAARRRGKAWRAIPAALFCLIVGAAATAARADWAAGQAAYEKGDYARALAEWRDAAKTGDPKAEFGLGELNEFGYGGLKQNYKRAESWYEKAARQGDTEAKYRLALILVAGSENFPPRLAEAYKWAVLGAEGKGVWASLAANLKNDLKTVTNAEERAEGRKRAAAWETARLTAKGAAQKPGAPAVAPSPIAPKPKPAVAVLPKPPKRPALPPLEQLKKELAQFDCAALRARNERDGLTVISGTVSKAPERDRLFRLAARLFPGRPTEVKVEIVPPPVCRSLAALDRLRRAGALVEEGLRLTLAAGGPGLVEGEPIKVELKGPDYATNIRIDYFSLDGRVLHLWPNAAEPVAHLGAGATRVFWDAGGGKTWNAGGAPFGTELITAIATTRPLDLGSALTPVEPAADYLHALRQALGSANGSGRTRSLLALLLVKTHAR